MHRHIYCKKVKDGIKCCAGNAEQSGISVGEKGSPDTKPYLNNCKQNNQNGGCDIREAQIFPEWVKGKEHKWKEVKKCIYAYFDDAIYRWHYTTPPLRSCWKIGAIAHNKSVIFLYENFVKIHNDTTGRTVKIRVST